MTLRPTPTSRWQFRIRHLLFGMSGVGLVVGLLRQLFRLSELTREQRVVFATVLMIGVYCGICGIMYSRLCGSNSSTAWIVGTSVAVVFLMLFGILTAAGF